MREAQAAMSEELNKQLFGPPKVQSELRRCISEAVDEHAPHLKDAKPKYKTATEAAIMTEAAYGLNTNNIIWDGYKAQITENIFKESAIIGAFKNQEAKKVSDDYAIAAKAAEKRKEAKAEAIIDIVGDYFESTDWVDGDTVSWAVEFYDSAGKTYHYVAVRGGNNWYITADSKTYSTDKIVEHITYLALRGLRHVRALRSDVMEPPKLEPKDFSIFWADLDQRVTSYSNVTGSARDGNILSLIQGRKQILVNLDEVRYVLISDDGSD